MGERAAALGSVNVGVMFINGRGLEGLLITGILGVINEGIYLLAA